jgi:hypothetical protein
MILIAFPLPLSKPVHEESVGEVDHGDRSQHDNGQACSREPGEKPSKKARLPNDSPMMTKSTTIRGIPIFWVKDPMVRDRRIMAGLFSAYG